MRTRWLGLILVVCLGCSAIVGCRPQMTQRRATRARALRSLGLQYYKQKRVRLALKNLLDSEKLNPYDYWTQEALGGIFMFMGNTKKAKEHYDKALDLKRDWPRAWNNLGVFYMQQQKLPQAVTHFQKGLGKVVWHDPCELRTNLGRAYLMQKKSQNALDELRLASRDCKGPVRCVMLLWKGLAARQANASQEEVASFKGLTELCKSFALGHFQLAQAFMRRQQYDRAAASLRRCMQLSRNRRLRLQCDTLSRKLRKKVARRDDL